jgi:hypothetical protein
VLPGVPAGDQPPVDPSPLKLLVAQRLRDLSDWFGERDLAATELQRDLAARGSVDAGGSERHDPGGRFAVEQLAPAAGADPDVAEGVARATTGAASPFVAKRSRTGLTA